MSENPDARREIPHQVIDDWPLPLGVVSVVGWICAVPLVFTPGVVLVFLLHGPGSGNVPEEEEEQPSEP